LVKGLFALLEFSQLPDGKSEVLPLLHQLFP
jgi:hypothetical protein